MYAKIKEKNVAELLSALGKFFGQPSFTLWDAEKYKLDIERNSDKTSEKWSELAEAVERFFNAAFDWACDFKWSEHSEDPIRYDSFTLYRGTDDEVQVKFPFPEHIEIEYVPEKGIVVHYPTSSNDNIYGSVTLSGIEFAGIPGLLIINTNPRADYDFHMFDLTLSSPLLGH